VGENGGAYRVLVGKPEGKTPLGRSRRRLEGNIKMDLQVRDGDMDWIDLAQDRDRWRDLGNAVLIHKMRGISRLVRTVQLLKKDSVPWSCCYCAFDK
jgi:hypothetical protein